MLEYLKELIESNKNVVTVTKSNGISIECRLIKADEIGIVIKYVKDGFYKFRAFPYTSIISITMKEVE